jgi:hypothetical protein
MPTNLNLLTGGGISSPGARGLVQKIKIICVLKNYFSKRKN